MYTIGQVSEMFDIPVSTLRYYDKEGLFPSMERKNGIRRFDIKQFMQWCSEGPATYERRRELFERRREAVLEEMARLRRTLAMLEFKCWYYDTAIADGGEERIASLMPDRLPAKVQGLYNYAHGFESREAEPTPA